MLHDLPSWSTKQASELYEIQGWGKGYFSIHPDGHVIVHPDKDPNRYIDMMRLMQTLRTRGIEAPVLLRFPQIVRHRLAEMHNAFQSAITNYGYHGRYSCVYPIKVNQQRQVVEEILHYGSEHGFGLEAGSKPELMAVIAIASNETPIICNGFKDEEFIQFVTLAQKMGRNIIPVIEKFSELELILSHARELEVQPRFGLRAKLATRGSGRWKSSAGYRSKFGLTVSEIMRLVQRLEEENLQDSLQLLHFHMGSQITNIRPIKYALNEAARIYAELARMGIGVKYLDVGGGLGIDYDGSQTDFESSVNYSLQEYANDVVYHVQSVCDEVGVRHPDIISESGRAMVAYHSVLVFNVVGVSGLREDGTPAHVPQEIPEDYTQPLRDLMHTLQELNLKNALESLHDAQSELENAMNLFNAGYMSLRQRSDAENLYWAICRRIQQFIKQMDYIPDDVPNIDALLADTYFCNFSLFQSIPDSWAIKQMFPLMPIHRLDQRPTRHAVLGDVTCDSDGKIDQFIDRRDVKRTLPLHNYRAGDEYYLGAFLVGAYQEILGDLHNLFGDTHAVHVSLNEDNQIVIEAVIKGDTVREVLSYVEFDGTVLLGQLRTDVEKAVRAQKLTDEQAGRFLKFYESELSGYTYLE